MGLTDIAGGLAEWRRIYRGYDFESMHARCKEHIGGSADDFLSAGGIFPWLLGKGRVSEACRTVAKLERDFAAALESVGGELQGEGMDAMRCSLTGVFTMYNAARASCLGCVCRFCSPLIVAQSFWCNHGRPLRPTFLV